MFLSLISISISLSPSLPPVPLPPSLSIFLSLSLPLSKIDKHILGWGLKNYVVGWMDGWVNEWGKTNGVNSRPQGKRASSPFLGALSHQSPGKYHLPLPQTPPQRPCHSSSPSQGAQNSLFFSSLCVGNMWFYCQHGVSNERQIVSNVTWKKNVQTTTKLYVLFSCSVRWENMWLVCCQYGL